MDAIVINPLPPSQPPPTIQPSRPHLSETSQPPPAIPLSPLSPSETLLPTTTDYFSSSPNKPMSPGTYTKNTNISNLAKFRAALGTNAPDLPSSLYPHFPAPAIPLLYPKIIKQRRHLRRLYHIISVITYGGLGAQILIGAILASLGSNMETLHPMAITVLGIINTITAGILALMRSLGIFDSIKGKMRKLRQLKDWIEEVEVRLLIGVDGGGAGDGKEGERGLSEVELGVLLQAIFDEYNKPEDEHENRGLEGRRETVHLVSGGVGGYGVGNRGMIRGFGGNGGGGGGGKKVGGDGLPV